MVLPTYNATYLQNKWCLSMNWSLYTRIQVAADQHHLHKLGRVTKVNYTKQNLTELKNHRGVFFLTVAPDPQQASSSLSAAATAYAVLEDAVEDFSQVNGNFKPLSTFLAAFARRTSAGKQQGNWLRELVRKQTPTTDMNRSYTSSPAGSTRSDAASTPGGTNPLRPTSQAASSAGPGVFSGLLGGSSPAQAAASVRGSAAVQQPPPPEEVQSDPEGESSVCLLARMRSDVVFFVYGILH